MSRGAPHCPRLFMTASPRRYATPVFIRPSPTIDTAAIRITTGWPKPATASCIVSTREIERQHDEDGHNVNARTSRRKQHDGAAQYAENDQHRACHGRLPVAEAACSFAWIGAPRLRVGAPCTAPSSHTSAACAGTVAMVTIGRPHIVDLHFVKIDLTR